MNETLILVLNGSAGLGLGVFFFGGLWWTIRRGVSSQRPALLFFGSLLLRTGITLAGFHLVSDGDWQRILVCLLGFVIGRLIVTRLAGPPLEQLPAPVKEPDHAS
ncbi:ATP synthase subunit I [Marinobacterium aestuariivivens]|uniref:ATP synthase subunit I n=1 Tax=Marinobacterium aestuariivivens TaxID=1698799 RepID=A0ABW2A3R6_9GAMM